MHNARTSGDPRCNLCIEQALIQLSAIYYLADMISLSGTFQSCLSFMLINIHLGFLPVSLI